MIKQYPRGKNTLLLFVLIFFGVNVFAQCSYTAAEPNLPALSPTCSNQTSATIGAGTYIYYTGFVPNTYYNLSLNNLPGTITCAEALFADVTPTPLTPYYNIDGVTATFLAPANTYYLYVETAASSWNGTSAALNYSTATPTDPTWNSAPASPCINNTVTYSINASNYATGYVWTITESSGSSDYINGVPGQQTITESTGTITVTFVDASTAALSVYATNNGFCNSNTITLPIGVSTPASITTQPVGATICAGLADTPSVSATGNSQISYEWMYSDNGVWADVTNEVPAGVTYSNDSYSSLSISTSNTTPGGDYYYYCIVTNGLCSPVISDSILISVTPSVFDTVAVSLCPGSSYNGYTTTGTYTDTYQGSNGCDSIRTLDLTILPISTDTVVGTICQGGSFGGYTTAGTYTDTLTGSNGCDSFYVTQVIVYPNVYDTVNQTLCQGQTYDGYGATGTFIDTFAASDGCDSIRTLNLTILPLSADTVTLTICSNQNYYGYDTTGNYIDTLTGSNGCDSIRTLNLTVLPVVTSTISQSICPNQNYDGYTTTGTYIDTLTGSNGCDSIRTLNLTVLPVVSSSVNTTICPGQNYDGYTTTGTFIDTLTGSNGCDSIRTLNLIVLPVVTSTVAQSICPGQSYYGHDTTGAYIDTLTGSNGCDSIRTLNLVVLTNAIDRETKSICAGQSYEGYSATGVYVDTSTGMNGCDSFHILILTVQPVISDTVTLTICAGQNSDGHIASGTYIDTLTAVSGCDSIRTLNLTVSNAITTSLIDSICYGDTLMGHTISGIFVDTLINSNGCDSIVTLNLTVMPVLTTPTIAIVGTDVVEVNLPGDHYQWYLNGVSIPGDTTQSITITESGLYSVKVTNNNGCSIMSSGVNVTYIPVGIVQITKDPKLSLFPNPAAGTLNIQAEGLSSEESINIGIYDQLGQLALSETQIPRGTTYLTQVNIQNLAQGIYVVQLQQGNSIVRQKLVIER